jgi:hypothetical protein
MSAEVESDSSRNLVKIGVNHEKWIAAVFARDGQIRFPQRLASQVGHEYFTLLPPSDLASFLTNLQSGTRSLALKTVLDEAIFQYRRHRPIATALCLRIVLEAGLLEKVRTAFPTSYDAVSEKAIASLVQYIQSNSATFFDARKDHKILKCIQSNAIKGQGDVMMLNNISHGHYAPQMTEVEKFTSNLEPLLLWAYS